MPCVWGMGKGEGAVTNRTAPRRRCSFAWHNVHADKPVAKDRALCAEFPDQYHRKIDEERAYAEVFADDLTKQGWMAALVPEAEGGFWFGSDRSVHHYRTLHPRRQKFRCVPWTDVHYEQAGPARITGAAAKVSAQNRHGRIATAINGCDRTDNRDRHRKDRNTRRKTGCQIRY